LDWYEKKIARYGAWILKERPSRREIEKKVKTGSHRAAELRRRVLDPRPKNRATRILVIGDAHFEPGQSMERAHILGRFMRHQLTEDDYAVCIGDWHGLTSLCSYNSALANEGARLEADLESGNKARRVVDSYLGEGAPKRKVTLGNHEHRLVRVVEHRPTLKGIVGTHQLDWGDWDVHDYLEPLHIEGFRFQHCFTNGMGRAISSKKDPARRVLEDIGGSTVFGHTHRFDLSVQHTKAETRMSVNVGCFFEHEEEYAGPDQNAKWWRGLVVLHVIAPGVADVEQWSFRRLRERYG
jgi:hypothetical protein